MPFKAECSTRKLRYTTLAVYAESQDKFAITSGIANGYDLCLAGSRLSLYPKLSLCQSCCIVNVYMDLRQIQEV